MVKLGHLQGLTDADEEASVYARWVFPYYAALMGPARQTKNQRTVFVRRASVSAYWLSTPMIRILYGSSEWRARIAASFFTAVKGNAGLVAFAELALQEPHMVHDLFMHRIALAVLDTPDLLLPQARLEGPSGETAAALAVGGPRCRQATSNLGWTVSELGNPELIGRAQEVVLLVSETRLAERVRRAKLQNGAGQI